VAQHLARRFTVLRYDRRGFGRSRPTEPPHDQSRLRADADDVRHLIEHAAGPGPATVFGSSSGAIVALAARIDHTEAVAAVVAHEPPLMRLLPDGHQWIDFFHDTYLLYREQGVEPAMAAFRSRTFPPSDAGAMAHAPRNPANATFWFEHELRQYPAVHLDVEALGRGRAHVLPAAGQDSAGHPCRQAAAALAAALGRPMVDLPGGHIGFLTEPAEFARCLGGVLTDGNAVGPAGTP
jgi:pimeloyl-ACP methyl ester carboxylesterase